MDRFSTRQDVRRSATHERVAAAIVAWDRLQPLGLSGHASLEAQAAALADDIAYDAHDIDDGLRAELFSLGEIGAGVPFAGSVIAEIEAWRPGLEEARRVHELTRRVITRFIEDAIGESSRRIAEARIAAPADVEHAGGALVGLSAAFEAADREIKAFLFSHMYRHPKVQSVREKADGIVRNLFAAYMSNPSAMPPDWAGKAEAGERARAVADYIAGMTDRFAVHEHARLFDGPRELR